MEIHELHRLFEMEPPKTITVLGKGPSLDDFVANAREGSRMPEARMPEVWPPDGVAVFAINEAIHVAPPGSFWVYVDDCFGKVLPGLPFVAIRPSGLGLRHAGGYWYKEKRDLPRLTGYKSTSAAVVQIIGEWLRTWDHGRHSQGDCRPWNTQRCLHMVGFDGWDQPTGWTAETMYAQCLQPYLVKPRPKVDYGVQNQALRAALEFYKLWIGAKWFHREMSHGSDTKTEPARSVPADAR